MKTLIQCWDNASVYIVKDRMAAEGKYEPYDTRFDVHFCPAAEAWKEAEFHRWGHVYCDEFHQACASSYHPDGNVVIPQNLMKGDDHCHFQWIMPPSAEAPELGEPSRLGRELAKDYTASSELEAAWLALKRSNRLVGGRFVTAARVLLERHGEPGRAALVDGLRRWGAERGRILRAEHEVAGITPSLPAFVRNHDLPFALIWQPREVASPTGRLVVEFEETPQDAAWGDLRARDLGVLWYESAYPEMAAGYLPGVEARWVKLCARGDKVNRLELSGPHQASDLPDTG